MNLKSKTIITRKDLDAHNREASESGGGWVIIHGSVYDVLSIAEHSPCGVDKLMEYVGKDASKAFEGVSESAKDAMGTNAVGVFREVSLFLTLTFYPYALTLT